jgi:Cu-Zn family superoxide dismutase
LSTSILRPSLICPDGGSVLPAAPFICYSLPNERGHPVKHLLLTSLISLLLISPVYAENAKATLWSTVEGAHDKLGSILLEDTGVGLKIKAEVSGASPGKHGFHIHDFGSCADMGKAAGGHFNPNDVPHGDLITDGLFQAHTGDFGNFDIDPDGTGTLELTLPGLTVSNGTYAVAGRAFILHAKVDDFGQPTGNAGSRVGCGTIIVVSGE